MSAIFDRRCHKSPGDVKIRYRNKVQARKALDRCRQRLAAEGVPPEAWPRSFYRCHGRDACRGWHLTNLVVRHPQHWNEHREATAS